MRIALVHPYSWPRTRRGGERYLHDLGWYLSEAGHDVEILTGRDPEVPPTEVIDGCTVLRAWDRPGRRARRLPPALTHQLEVRRIRRALEKPYDLVHALWPAAASAAASLGHRVLYSLLGMPTSATRQEAPEILVDVQRGVRSASLSAALSLDARRHAEALFGGTWTVLPPGLRLDRFPLRDAPRDASPTYLFSASPAVPYKGLSHLVAAFALVLDDRPHARLVVSGQGEHRWALDTLPRRSRDRVEERLEVLGAGDLHHADARYASASVTVLPSENEAFGLSVVESLAAGTPVVACDHGGPAEILAADGIGETVPFGDPAALAAAMHRTAELAADPATPGRCAARAATWDWRREVGPAHERVYAALAGRPHELPVVVR